MSPPPPDDDPTHALDGFARRMRPAIAPRAPDDDPTSLAGLQARLHPEREAAKARPKGGVLRSGQAWDADDVVDVPEVRLPDVAAPQRIDTDALDATLRRASARSSAQFAAEDLAAAAAPWQPDLPALQLRRARHPRLLDAWRPGAWVGAECPVMGPATEFVTTASGTAVETYPPQRLLLLWPPQRLDQPLLGRWPQQALLSAVAQDQAAEALLAQVPADALLWLHGQPQDVDWALAAELVLTHQPALRPFQTTGLRSFIDAQREASFTHLNQHYQQAPGGARLR